MKTLLLTALIASTSSAVFAGVLDNATWKCPDVGACEWTLPNEEEENELKEYDLPGDDMPPEEDVFTPDEQLTEWGFEVVEGLEDFAGQGIYQQEAPFGGYVSMVPDGEGGWIKSEATNNNK